MTGSDDFKALHRLIRTISRFAVHSFFTELRVIGGENVPRDGPIIVYEDQLELLEHCTYNAWLELRHITI